MRWRPPTRPLILIALLLLVGAVVNVAVAWLPAPVMTTPHSVTRTPDAWSTLAAPADWPAPEMRIEYRDKRARIITEMAGVEETITAMMYESGWPCATLFFSEGLISQRIVGEGKDVDVAFPRRGLDFSSMTTWPGMEGLLPIAPIPAGFALNTLFYTVVVGAILALPLSFFPIRRRRRARRGRCPKCGYDLAGLGGADPEGGAPCPECGATR